ncbi:MAG: hypothetical protein HC809_11115 [Gammaproteobacteria bacterium]|nr:hypothetical protein [Gammaproteobacteria bacterium]
MVAHDLVADWSTDPELPLAHIDSLELDADLWPLLTGDRRLQVNGVAVSGLTANLIARDGNANWLPPGSAPTRAIPIPIAAAPPRSAAAAIEGSWQVAVVTLRDSRIDYDLDGDRYALDIDEIIVADVSPGRTSPVRASVTLTTAAQTIPLQLRADVTVSNNSVELADGELNGALSAPLLPFATTFSARYDTHRERLEVAFAARIDTLTFGESNTLAMGGAGFAAIAFAAPSMTASAKPISMQHCCHWRHCAQSIGMVRSASIGFTTMARCSTTSHSPL